MESSLPRLFLIADGFVSGRASQDAETVRERVLGLVEIGSLGVHLRDHAAPPNAFASTAEVFAREVRALRPGTKIIVNTHLRVAQAIGSGGHVGTRGPDVSHARLGMQHRFLGVSTHSATEARAAVDAGADYVFVSPIFPTNSHPGEAGLGFSALRHACEACFGKPVYALGGITPARTRACLKAGAYGVAVLSDLLDAPEPLDRFREYQTILNA